MCKRKVVPLVFFIAFLLLVSPPFPQTVRAQNGPQWRHLTTDDGLAANEVWAIMQDREGALWFGTYGGGVCRFDGRWQTFNRENTAGGLASNWVRAIWQADDGSFWFGTSQGLSHYDGHKWETFSKGSGLLGEDVRTVLQTDDGTLWAGTNGGLARYDGQTWQNLTTEDGLAGNDVTALWQDRNGYLWVGSDGGLNRCDLQGQFRCLTIENLAGVKVNALLEDWQGRLWVASTKGVSYYDGQEWRELTTADGLPTMEVRSLAQDDRGLIWMGTDGEGIASYDGQTFVTTLTTADGLPADYVRSIIQDRDGALWFGTLGGVSRYDTHTWQNMFPNHDITSIAPGPDGNLWVATAEKGVLIYDGHEWRKLTAKSDGDAEGLPSNRLEVLFRDSKGVLWIGTNGWGLSRYDGQTWETFTKDDGLASNSVTTIYETDDGLLWVGTHQGLSVFDGLGWETFTKDTTPELIDDFILSIAEDQYHTLWIGTKRGGVTRYDRTAQRWLEPLNRANSELAADEVRSILPSSDGTLWFGTWPGGASRHNGGIWETYTVADGLAANAIFTIIEDRTHVLWFGTLSGATRYDGRTWRSYTTSDGLINNAVKVIYEDKDGAIWLGTENGLTRYQPDTGVPLAHILAVNGKPHDEGQSILMLSGETLSINFAGGDLRTPTEGLVSLCYLEGVEDGWHLCREGTISYEHLNPGTYIFHLQVRDEDFNYSPPVALPITVEPGMSLPWIGRTLVIPIPAFISIIGLMTVAGGSLVLYTYTRRQTRRRAREALKRRFNPYISGEPIRREDMFFGRQKLLQHIMHILHNNSIMIHGERRIGKTSLLYQLANRLREYTDPDYLFIPVLVDLEGTPQEAFFHTLMDNILQACRPLLPEMPDLIFDTARNEEYTDRDFGRDFSRLLKALQKTTDKEVRVIMLIDEMDVIDTYNRMVQLQLRRIFMKEFAQNLGAVVAGVEISKEWDRPESPWYNLFNEVEIPPFSEEEARELITEPVKGVYRYDEEAVKRIIAYSQGRPHRIQQYCLEAVNHMLAARRTRVKVADVEKAHKTAIQAWGEPQQAVSAPAASAASATENVKTQ